MKYSKDHPLYNDHKNFNLPEHWWAVNFLPHEIKMIEENGKRRTNNGTKKGLTSRTTNRDYKWDIAGYAGEFAVSILLNTDVTQVETNTLNDFMLADVGNKVEVKTRLENDPRRWDLAINEDQLKEDRIYILCLGIFLPKWILIVGWQYGYEIKKDSEFKNHSSSNHKFYVYDYRKLKEVKSIFDVIKL